jgi:hypothetical protein
MRFSRALAVATIVVAGLSGCTASSAPDSPDTAGATAEAQATASADATPGPTLTLDDLHESYIATGLPCAWVITENVMSGSFESGVCRNSENTLNTFATQADLDGLLELNEASPATNLFLVGDLWAVGSESPEDLMTAQTGLGGTLWPADSPFFETD